MLRVHQTRSSFFCATAVPLSIDSQFYKFFYSGPRQQYFFSVVRKWVWNKKWVWTSRVPQRGVNRDKSVTTINAYPIAARPCSMAYQRGMSTTTTRYTFPPRTVFFSLRPTTPIVIAKARSEGMHASISVVSYHTISYPDVLPSLSTAVRNLLDTN